MMMQEAVASCIKEGKTPLLVADEVAVYSALKAKVAALMAGEVQLVDTRPFVLPAR